MKEEIINYKEPKTPYEAGFYAGQYGADVVNSNFKWFDTPESTKQWEMGNAAGSLKFKKP